MERSLAVFERSHQYLLKIGTYLNDAANLSMEKNGTNKILQGHLSAPHILKAKLVQVIST
jgi:hypothetical protein